jgi:hypothetical protein
MTEQIAGASAANATINFSYTFPFLHFRNLLGYTQESYSCIVVPQTGFPAYLLRSICLYR